MDKKDIRQAMLGKRNALTSEEQKIFSRQIADMVIKSDIYRNAENVCVYQAFRKEVSCDRITENAFAQGKRVFVPVTDTDSKTMEFYQIMPETHWKEGAYGIMEPLLDASVLKLDCFSEGVEKTLILMPGLVFDRQKHRIGYGGGYYDKYLAMHKKHVTFALCYDFQVVEESLPYEEHDILPDYVVTECEMY